MLLGPKTTIQIILKFHPEYVDWVGLRNIRFIVHLMQLSARENFMEILLLGYLYLFWHRLNDFFKSEYKKKRNAKFSPNNVGQEKYTQM